MYFKIMIGKGKFQESDFYQELVTEIVDDVENKIPEHIDKKIETIIQPLIKKRVAELKGSIVQHVMKKLEEKYNLSPLEKLDTETQAEMDKIDKKIEDNIKARPSGHLDPLKGVQK